jgi:hypothetical protein
MEDIREATIEAINSFVREQRSLPGSVQMKLVQFDVEYEVVFDKDLRDVHEYNQSHFKPRGATALYDAQCRAIDELGAELAATSEAERPEKVIVVTMTDGIENSSTKFKLHDVKNRIKTQQEQFNWAFVYLGANQDAVEVGQNLGMQRGQSMSYTATTTGVRNTMRAANKYVHAVRSMPVGASVQGITFSDEERKQAMEDTPVGVSK